MKSKRTASVISRRQLPKTAQSKIFQKDTGGPISHGPAYHFSASHLLDKSALGQCLHDSIHRHASDLFDLSARDGLAISNDRERFERRLGQARRAHLMADQRLEPRGVFGLSHELPRSGHTRQPVTAIGFLMQLPAGV